MTVSARGGAKYWIAKSNSQSINIQCDGKSHATLIKSLLLSLWERLGCN